MNTILSMRAMANIEKIFRVEDILLRLMDSANLPQCMILGVFEWQ